MASTARTSVALTLRRAAHSSRAPAQAVAAAASTSAQPWAAPGVHPPSHRRWRTTTTSTRSAAAAGLALLGAGPQRRGVAPSRPASLPARRRAGLHTLPTMQHRFEGKGCPPFLSPQAFDRIFIEWHGGLLERLNDEVRGTDFEMMSVAKTVTGTAQDRSMILAFNLASQALNNSFFLNGLRPPRPGAAPVDPLNIKASATSTKHNFAEALRASYHTVAQLKSAFSAAALGMASSGWVWLVRDQHGKLGIVPTYGAGTLLVQHRQLHHRGGTFASEGEVEGEHSDLASPPSSGLRSSFRSSLSGDASSASASPLLRISEALAASGQRQSGGVTPSAGQQGSAVERNNVGATVGGGVAAPRSSPAPAVGEGAGEGQAAGVSDASTANRTVPPQPGANSSPAAQGNVGGTMGGGIGVGPGGGFSRSFSTSATMGAPPASGSGTDDYAGVITDFITNPRRSSTGSISSSSSSSSSTTTTTSPQTSYPIHSYSAGLGGLRRPTTMRTYLDEYQADAGAVLFPLLCLSVHEHAWMTDYGLWGKEEYLRQFWECVDWNVVWQLYDAYEY